MKVEDWWQHICERSDLTLGLVHLTRGTTRHSALNILIKILKEKKLVASTDGYICGHTPVVCFLDAPLHSIAETVKFEKSTGKSRRCEGIGLRFIKPYIYRKGGRPVIYDKSINAKKLLQANEHWRIVDFNLDDDTSIVDWTHEREWRLKGDLSFELGDVEVIIDTTANYRRFIETCLKEENQSILKEIKGITVLTSALY